ncbi:MAG: hypothetical protein Q7S17_00760 [Xanthobacteraceae bacterium]|nr:hypothetical protein [Xanthobacteraceae bacterium]
MFYVYRIFGQGGETLYIGKGSGDRLRHQMKRFRENGEVIARYENEDAAYREEATLIAQYHPPLNIAPGGRGGAWTGRRKKTEPEIMAGLLRKLITAAPGVRFYLLGEDITDGIVDIIAAWFGRVGYETARSELAKHAITFPPLDEFATIA